MSTRVALALAALALAAGVPMTMAPAQLAKDDWLPSQQHGIAFAKDPSGAIITRVVKDSGAERAGVTVGMVITHIDGLPLRELTAIQIARIFAGTGSRVELKIRGAGLITVSEPGFLNSAGAAVRLGPPDR